MTVLANHLHDPGLGARAFVRLVGLAGAVALQFATMGAARADEKAACAAAASEGQTLRDSHNLVEAREQFRSCARTECPLVIQRDCSGWVNEVESRLPTVMVSAPNAAGSAFEKVVVNVDGRPFSATLDGPPVEIDPGEHLFEVELPDGRRWSARALIAEGQKAQRIALEASGETSEQPERPFGGGRAWTVAGCAVGAAGLIGIGIGTYYGAHALSEKGDHCMGTICSPGTVDGIGRDADISTVSFVAGGALLASGAALLFLASHLQGGTARPPPVAVRLDVQPRSRCCGGSEGDRGAVVSLAGTF